MKVYKIILSRGQDVYFEDEDSGKIYNAIPSFIEEKDVLVLENATVNSSFIVSVILEENYPGVVKGEDGFYYLEGKMCDREGNVYPESHAKYFKNLENKRLN